MLSWFGRCDFEQTESLLKISKTPQKVAWSWFILIVFVSIPAWLLYFAVYGGSSIFKPALLFVDGLFAVCLLCFLPSLYRKHFGVGKTVTFNREDNSVRTGKVVLCRGMTLNDLEITSRVVKLYSEREIFERQPRQPIEIFHEFIVCITQEGKSTDLFVFENRTNARKCWYAIARFMNWLSDKDDKWPTFRPIGSEMQNVFVICVLMLTLSFFTISVIGWVNFDPEAHVAAEEAVAAAKEADAAAEKAKQRLRVSHFHEAVSSGFSWVWRAGRDFGSITFHEDGEGRMKIDHRRYSVFDEPFSYTIGESGELVMNFASIGTTSFELLDGGSLLFRDSQCSVPECPLFSVLTDPIPMAFKRVEETISHRDSDRFVGTWNQRFMQLDVHPDGTGKLTQNVGGPMRPAVCKITFAPDRTFEMTLQSKTVIRGRLEIHHNRLRLLDIKAEKKDVWSKFLAGYYTRTADVPEQ